MINCGDRHLSTMAKYKIAEIVPKKHSTFYLKFISITNYFSKTKTFAFTKVQMPEEKIDNFFFLHNLIIFSYS